MSTVENVIITGASAGIGHALAQQHLERGFRVIGLSRTAPADLVAHPNFVFHALDLASPAGLEEAIGRMLDLLPTLDEVRFLFLNAGQYGSSIKAASALSRHEIDHLMRVNVWGNKAVLDALLQRGVRIDTCVFSASIAGVRARAGNGAYGLSKATLLMLAQLYALEHPEVFFAVLGLCLVDTRLSRNAAMLPVEGDFPEIAMLRERAAAPGYMLSAGERASTMCALLWGDYKSRIGSGQFVEMRTLGAALAAA